ncbi:lipoyltransferase 1, mitochondrial [Protopterus annectens]|uniref:lipoyltransferase 1, mitochondrial n=1 Tax=Protopterus annectens TaxID=7888 RepID=UPI001CF9D8E7|nr:lipoyltransferase 1, mitochondrial [Protopterus annectens]
MILCLSPKKVPKWILATYHHVRHNHNGLIKALTESNGIILQSLSTDIYLNLAAENWLHETLLFDKKQPPALFLWRNSATVVIGRHQNPWQECNLQLMRDNSIRLARRKSGGGAVYHDLGNINLTFFTSKQSHNRLANLTLITRALKAVRPHLNITVSERHDLLLNGSWKISGTAAKLGRMASYHHCTLLCNADRGLLSAVLKSPFGCDIQSNATASVSASVKNLCEVDDTLTPELLMGAIAAEFARQHRLHPRIQLIDPADESALPGVGSKAAELRSWEWVYGRTPVFSINCCFDVGSEKTPNEIQLNVTVKGGRIESCSITSSKDWLPFETCQYLSANLVGSKFCPIETKLLVSALMRIYPQDFELRSRCSTLCEKMIEVM